MSTPPTPPLPTPGMSHDGGAGPPSPPDAAQVEFVLSLGRALHNYGYPAHHLEDALGQTARRLGLEAHFFSTPTSIFAAFGQHAAQRTHLIRVEPGDVDLGKLVELHRIAQGVVSGELPPADGRDAIANVVGGRRYGPLLTVLAFAVASGGAARVLGGGGPEVVVGLVIGLLVGLLARALGRVPNGGRVFEPTAALIAGIVATSAATAVPGLAVLPTTLGGLIVLIPGLTLTTAMTELSTRHLVSGTARLAGATVTFLTIAFGVAIGNRLGTALAGPAVAGAASILPPWTFAAALVVSPLAFVVLLRAHLRDAPWIVAAGCLAVVGAQQGAAALGVELGVFFGSLVVGLAGSIYARAFDRPPQVIVVPAILMLVPGSIGFRSLNWLMEREVILGVETAFTTVLMAVALAAGLVLANVVLPPRRSPSSV